jgi:transcriptional regulator with XRE-family HTH domain
MADLNYGTYLRTWRRGRGHTQAQVAQAIGRSSWYVCGIERGFVEPDAEDRRRIAEALNMPPYEAE